MKRYILIHSHKHGIESYGFSSNSSLAGWWEEEDMPAIAEKLGIDFDARQGETLTWFSAPESFPEV